MVVSRKVRAYRGFLQVWEKVLWAGSALTWLLFLYEAGILEASGFFRMAPHLLSASGLMLWAALIWRGRRGRPLPRWLFWIVVVLVASPIPIRHAEARQFRRTTLESLQPCLTSGDPAACREAAAVCKSLEVVGRVAPAECSRVPKRDPDQSP